MSMKLEILVHSIFTKLKFAFFRSNSFPFILLNQLCSFHFQKACSLPSKEVNNWLFVSCLHRILTMVNYASNVTLCFDIFFRKFAFDRPKILTNLHSCWFISAVYLILYHPFFVMLMISYWRTICASSGLVPSQVWQLAYKLHLLVFRDSFAYYFIYEQIYKHLLQSTHKPSKVKK